MKTVRVTYQNPKRTGLCGMIMTHFPQYITREFTIDDNQDVAVVLTKNPERKGLCGFFRFKYPKYILATRKIQKSD